MALIACPKCGKRISDKAETCKHCGALMVEDPEKLRTAGRIERIHKSSRLMSQSFIALILFIGGLAYSSFDPEAGETTAKWVAQGIAGAGFIWYLILRVQIMMFKKEKV